MGRDTRIFLYESLPTTHWENQKSCTRVIVLRKHCPLCYSKRKVDESHANNGCGSDLLPHYVTSTKRLATIRRQDTTFLLSFQPSQTGLCASQLSTGSTPQFFLLTLTAGLLYSPKLNNLSLASPSLQHEMSIPVVSSRAPGQVVLVRPMSTNGLYQSYLISFL